MDVSSEVSRRQLLSCSALALLPNVWHQPRSWDAKYPMLSQYCKAMRAIKGRTLSIGSDSHAENERPRHSITLSTFKLGASPVTVGLWKEYCAATQVEMPTAPAWGWLDDHPIVNVSYTDITTATLPSGKPGFLTWAVITSGVQLMLPTESQWEAAAQSKNPSDDYAWGADFDINKLWCSKESWKDAGKTASTTRKDRIFTNHYGIRDLIGNVWEWCQDWNGPYTSELSKDPIGPPSGMRRAIRGGSWYNEWPDVFRTSYRYRMLPEKREDNIGFRLAAAK